MEIIAGIISLIVLIVFFGMTANIGGMSRRMHEINARQANIEKWLRLIARLQSGVPLTEDEKAILMSAPNKESKNKP